MKVTVMETPIPALIVLVVVDVAVGDTAPVGLRRVRVSDGPGRTRAYWVAVHAETVENRWKRRRQRDTSRRPPGALVLITILDVDVCFNRRAGGVEW